MIYQDPTASNDEGMERNFFIYIKYLLKQKHHPKHHSILVIIYMYRCICKIIFLNCYSLEISFYYSIGFSSQITELITVSVLHHIQSFNHTVTKSQKYSHNTLFISIHLNLYNFVYYLYMANMLNNLVGTT